MLMNGVPGWYSGHAGMYFLSRNFFICNVESLQSSFLKLDAFDVRVRAMLKIRYRGIARHGIVDST